VKNQEQKVINDEQRKTHRIFQMIKVDVKKCEGEVRLQEQKAIRRKKAFNKSWILMTALFNLMKAIRERKGTVMALRIIKSIRDSNAVKVQKKVRGYIHRVLLIKNQDHLNPSDSDLYTQQEAKVGLHMFHAFNSLALMAKKTKATRAEKIMTALFSSIIEPAQLTEACAPFNEKVKRIQRQWKAQITKIQARVEVFIMCWNEHCNKLLENAKSKKQILVLFQKIRKEQVLKAARQFVFAKMRNQNRASDLFANLHLQIKLQKQGTLDLQVQTPKLPAGGKGANPNNSKSNINSPQLQRKDNKKKTTMLEKPGAKQAPVVEKKEEVKEIVEENNNFKYKPNAQEIKEIFQVIVEEAEKDSAMSP